MKRIPSYSYHCKRCRHYLFCEDDILIHQQGIGQGAFAYHKRSFPHSTLDSLPSCSLSSEIEKDFQKDSSFCSSMFLDDSRVSWIGEMIADTIDGKLTCPHCHARIGSWRWDGAQCSCGTWQTPSFQILKNRVDQKQF